MVATQSEGDCGGPKKKVEEADMSMLRILIAFGILTFSTGCQHIVSLHPLYTEKDLVSEPALEGTWVMQMDGVELEAIATHEVSESNSYQLTYTFTFGSADKGWGAQFQAHPVRLGDHLFLDLSLNEDATKKLFENRYWPKFSRHLFCRIKIEGDGLQVAFLNQKWLKKKIDSGDIKLAYELAEKNVMVITSSTQELQAFAIKYADDRKIFRNPRTYYRRPAEVGHFNQGEVYRSQDLHDEAVASYEKALELKPDYAEAHRGLGDVYGFRKLYDQAITSYKKALDLMPDHAEAHKGLADAYRERKRYAAAIVSYRNALEIKSDYAEAHHDLSAVYRSKGLYQEAFASSKRAAKLQPKNSCYRRDLGMNLIFLGKYGQGRKELRKALAQDSRVTWGGSSARLDLGFSYFLQNRFQGAMGEFEKSERYPGGMWRYLALKHLGREEEAQKHLDEYVEGFQNPEPPNWEMALGLFHQGKLSEADLLSRIRNKRQQCEGFFHIGYRAFFQADEQKAQKYFQKAVDTKAFDRFEFAVARARLEQLSSE